MGNTCTKELSSISALINKAGGDANAARYKKTELNSLSTGLHSSESTTVKESQVKYAILHPQIRDLLLRLSYDEIQIILNIFRLKVRQSRSGSTLPPSANAFISPRSDAGDPNHLSISSALYPWKRLSLSKKNLYDILPSFHPSSLHQTWLILQQDFTFPKNNATHFIEQSIKDGLLINADNILKMFLFSDYKNGISSQSEDKDFPKDIIFQDFCTISSILLHGSKEELFTLLFLLFSEEMIIPNTTNKANNPNKRSQQNIQRGLSSNHPSQGTIEDDHGFVAPSKSHSIDPIISPSSSGGVSSHKSNSSLHSSSPPKQHEVESSPVHENSAAEDIPPLQRTLSEPTSKKLVLTEKRLLELYVFVAMMLYHEPSLSVKQRAAVRQSSDFMKLITSLRELLSQHNGKHVEQLLNNSTNTAHNSYYTLSAFLSGIFPQNHPGSSTTNSTIHGTGGNLLANLNVPRVLASGIYHPIFYDFIPNPYEILKKVFDTYSSASSISALQKSLKSYSGLFHAGNGAAGHQEDRQKELAQQSYEIFLIESGWWTEFCDKMEVTPVYSDVVPYLVIDIHVTSKPKQHNHTKQHTPNSSPRANHTPSHTSNSTTTAFSSSKYELFDIFCAGIGDLEELAEEGDHHRSNMGEEVVISSVVHAMSLSLLNNRQLLKETLPAQFEYLPPDHLTPLITPFSSSNGVASDGKQYVALPFEIGKALYEAFDVSATTFSADVFRRSLRFVHNTASSEYVAYLANHKDSLTSAIHHFVNNFHIPFTIFIDVYSYYSLPIYTASSLGLATIEPIIDEFYYYNTKETMTIKQWLIQNLQQYGRLSIDFGHSEPLERSFRVWALVGITAPPVGTIANTTTTSGGGISEDIAYPNRKIRLPFNQSYEWVLITENDHDYQLECHGNLWNLFPWTTTESQQSNNKHTVTRRSTGKVDNNVGNLSAYTGKKDFAIALMIENVTEEGQFPSEHILTSELWKNIRILSQKEEQEEEHQDEPRNSDENGHIMSNVLRIGLLVDIFNPIQQRWQVGEVINIMKMDYFNDLSNAKRKITLSIRCRFSDSVDENDAVVFELPLESNHLLVHGTITDLISVQSLPSLLMEDQLRVNAVEIVKKSHVFHQIIQQSSTHLQRSETASSLPQTQNNNPAANGNNNALNSILVTPAKGRNSSVVPITVAFTPEPATTSSSIHHDDSHKYSTPVKGKPSGHFLGNGLEDILSSVTIEEIERMDWKILQYIAEEDDSFKLYYTFYLSEDYYQQEIKNFKELTMYVSNRNHPAVIRQHRSLQQQNGAPFLPNRSLQGLFYFPGHGGMNLISSDNNENRNSLNNTTNTTTTDLASPGKQLLSKWEKLFPNGSGNGTNGSGNSNGNTNSVSTQATNHAAENSNGRKGRTVNSANNRSNYSVTSATGTAINSNNSSMEKIPSHNNNGTNAVVPLTTTSVHQPTVAAPPSLQPPVVSGGGSGGGTSTSITRMGIIGLNNLGNTCFLSSALQCLLRTPIFIPYFLSYQYKFDINDRSKFGTNGKLTEEFAEFVRTVYNPYIGSNNGVTNLNNKERNSNSNFFGTGDGKQQFYYFGRNKANNNANPSAGNTNGNSNGGSLNNSAHNNGHNNSSTRLRGSNGSVNTGALTTATTNHPSTPTGLQQTSIYSRVTISPTTFYKLFQGHKTQFSGADQQDAQEFLSELLDTFHEDLKNNLLDNHNQAVANTSSSSAGVLTSANSSLLRNVIYSNSNRRSLIRLSMDHQSSLTGSQLLVGNSSANAAGKINNAVNAGIAAAVREIIFNGDKAWDEYAKRNDSIVTNVFQGQLCTHVSCESCGKANTRFEPFTTLSLPIPKAVINNSTLSLNGHSNHEVYTVIIKFYRKLPRWSSYWRLRHYLITTIGPSSSSALSIEDIDTLMRKSILIELLKQRKETKRFVIKCTKNMTIETLKVKCIDYLQTIYSKKRSSPKATDYSQKTFQQVFNGGKAAATSSSQLERVESIEEADEQQQSQQRRNGSTGGELPFPDELQQELKIANLTMIDISSDEKYRIRKIVENKEYLSAVIDENSNNSNECELLLIENNKDINFISSLPGNKLNVNPDSFLRHHNQILSSVLSTPLTRDILVNKKAEDWDHLLTRLFFGFVEEEEYYENNFYHHLLLHTYPPLGITPSSQALMSRSSGSLGGTGILPTSTGLPAEKVICDLDYRYSNQHASATTPSNSSTRERARSSSSASNSSQSHHQTFTKPFPKNMADLQLYDRVDALDHKDQWYSGSVVEILTFPGVVIDVPTVATPSSHSKKNKSGSSSSSKDRPPLSSSNSGRQDSLRHHQNNEQQQQQQRQKPDEIFIRVHFDNYSFVWDEWYDLSEFQQGCITSIYTKANRKLKIYDIQIVQRKLVYTVSPSNKAGSGNNNLGVYGSLDLTKIELIEQPFILQVESYRTISHLYSQIVEQMSRYLPVEYVESLIFDQTSSSSSSQSFETIKLPFEVRMLNIQNLYASPNQPLNYSTCYISTEKTDRSRERFERHKQWEGLNLPRYDRDRPVSNVYHPKLILTVDWEYILLPPNSTSSPTSSQPNTARASPNPSNTPALIILADYVSYINSLPPQQPPQLQHSPSVEERGRASSTASVNSSSGGGGKGNNTSQVTTTAAVRCSVIQMLPDARYEDDATFTEYDKLNNYQYSMTSTTSITSNHHQNQVNGSNTGGGNDGSNITSGGSTSYPWNFDATKGHRNADRKVYHLATSGVSPSSPNGNSNNSKDPRPGLTIENVLSNFTAKEEIQDYYCEHCKELKKGIMYSSIHKSPDILILHLKRLIMNSTGGAKIRTLVKFPLQNLNISQFMTQSMALKSSRPRSNSAAVDPTLMTDKNYGGGGGGSLSGNEAELAEVEQFMTSGDGIEGVENNYDLFGVVNHLGGMFGGHYTAYAQCEDLHYTSNNTTPAPPSTSHTSNEGERHIYTTASELKSILYDHSEVNLKDYSLSPGTINPTSFLPTPPHTTAYLNNLAQQQTSSLRIGQHLQPQASLETTYRWYKFDDDYAIELTSQYAPIEPTIVSESAYLLFYKKKQLSRESILRYT